MQEVGLEHLRKVGVVGWIFLCRAKHPAVVRIHWEVQSSPEQACSKTCMDPAVRAASVSLRGPLQAVIEFHSSIAIR